MAFQETSPTGSEKAADLYDLQVEAQAAGDDSLAAYLHQAQVDQTVLNQGLLAATGQPPGSPIETGGTVDPNIEIYRQLYAHMEKESAVEAVLRQHDLKDMGVFLGEVLEQYKDKNGQAAMKNTEFMSPEEQFAYAQTLQPVEVDPNRVADLRQKLVKLDMDLKQVDPNASVYTHPKTQRIANWIARETGEVAPGYLISGEQQPEETGFIGNRALEVTAFAEGATGFGLNLLAGIADLSANAIKGIMGEEYGLPFAVATNYIEDEDGNLVNNGGKVPGIVETVAAVNARTLGEKVNEYVHRMDAAREFEKLQANGFDRIMRGAAGIAGMGIGFGLPAGAAMGAGVKAGNLVHKGLYTMGAAGSSERVVKLTQILARTAGAGVANGLAEGVAFGRQDGYGNAFVHGMAMAPVLMAFGAMGRGVERKLLAKNMPAAMTRAISGALEGAGFGTLEAAQTGALWKLMKDPSQSNWEIYAKNMLGFAMFKMAMGHSVVDTPKFGEQAVAMMGRRAGREKLGEEVAEADAASEKAGEPVGERPTIESILKERGPHKTFEERQTNKQLESMMVAARELGYFHGKDYTGEMQGYLDKHLADGLTPTEAALKATKDLQRAHPTAHPKDKELDGTDYPVFFHAGPAFEAGTYKSMQRTREAKEAAERKKAEEEVQDFGNRAGEGIEKMLKEELEGNKPDATARMEIDPDMARRAAEAGDTVGRAPTAEEMGKELERMMALDEAEARAAEPRLSADEIRQEVARLRAEGPTPENRARLIELLQKEQGRITEGVGELYRQVNEQIPTDRWARKAEPPREIQEPGRPKTPSETLDARVKASGIPREILRELGEISKARRAARTPAESKALWDKQLRLERELDALEMSQDPVMDARLRDAIREMEAEALDTPDPTMEAGTGTRHKDASTVDPDFGERHGPSSMRKGANPHRQQENQLKPGEKPVRISDIIEALKGRPGFPGVRLLGKRLLARLPTAVQIAIRTGRSTSARGTSKGNLGVFSQYENLARTKEGQDLSVALHEWAHAMQRQVQIGEGHLGFAKGVKEWWKTLDDTMKDELYEVIRHYPGAEKLPIWLIAAEGWAEWHARKLQGDPTLEAEVPVLSEYLNAWLKNQPQLLKQYGEITKMMDIYRRQGAEARVDKSQRRGKPAPQGDLIDKAIGQGNKAWDSIVKNFFDDMHMLKKSQRKWMELSDVKIEDLGILDDPARLFDAIAMTAQKQAHSLIHRGMHHLDLTNRSEPLQAVFDDIGRGESREVRNQMTVDFINYLVSTRALELMAIKKTPMGKIIPGKKQTLPKSDYVETQKRILERNPEFAGLAKRMKFWSDGLLDLVAEAGNVPKADVQRMKDFGTVYVPFVRALEGVVNGRAGRGVAEKGNALKTMKGDTREIMDPMQALMDTTTTMVAKAHQQMVMKALYKMTMTADVGALATVVAKGNVPKEYRLDQVFRQMEKAVMKRLREEGLEPEDLEGWTEAFEMFDELIGSVEISDQMITLFSQKVMPFGEGANLVAYTPRLTSAEISALPKSRQYDAHKQNGKMQWLELDPDAYTALMGLDQPIGPSFLDHGLMKALLVWPKKAVRFFATDANPAFVAANAIRDATSAATFSAEGKFQPFSGWRKFFEGAALLTKGGLDRKAGRDTENLEWVDMYEASGARTASLHNEGVRREMRGEAADFIGRAKETVSKVANAYTNFLGQPESFIRIVEFKRVHQEAIANGKSHNEAAMLALEAGKEATVNFARAGVVARAYNQMTPYFSASFAGQRKMLRAITGMEGKNDVERAHFQSRAIANGIAGITIPTMVVWALTHDEEWYRDLPEWRKRHFVNMKLPGYETILSLPLPFELGSVFGTMPQILGDALTDSNPAEFFPTFKDAMFPYMSGLSGLLPAGAKPWLQSTSGYDFFTGSEQTPFWVEQSNLPADQVRPGTTVMAKEMFEALQGPLTAAGISNPIELQQFLGDFTAGASTSLLRATDELRDVKDHPGIQPGMAAALSGFYNRFARQTPHRSSRAVDDFYRLATKTDQAGTDKRLIRELGRDRQAMAAIRRQVQDEQISQVEGDRRIYEIAQRRLDKVK